LYTVWISNENVTKVAIISWDDYNLWWPGNESKISKSWNLLLGEGCFLSVFFNKVYSVQQKQNHLLSHFLCAYNNDIGPGEVTHTKKPKRTLCCGAFIFQFLISESHFLTANFAV